MKALVMAESSGTTNNGAEIAIDYYQGNFLPATQLIDRLDSYCDVDTYIITDSHGLVPGSSKISEQTKQSKKQALEDASFLLTESAPEFDVVVVLLTTDVFQEVVADHWEEMVEDVNEDAIWCLGTSRSAILDCGVGNLQDTIRELFIYERVGVAPIDNNTRESLLASVESRAKELQ